MAPAFWRPLPLSYEFLIGPFKPSLVELHPLILVLLFINCSLPSYTSITSLTNKHSVTPLGAFLSFYQTPIETAIEHPPESTN